MLKLLRIVEGELTQGLAEVRVCALSGVSNLCYPSRFVTNSGTRRSMLPTEISHKGVQLSKLGCIIVGAKAPSSRCKAPIASNGLIARPVYTRGVHRTQ